MKILVIGSGGREHAICWKLARSPRKPRLYCAPGNAGIAAVAECVPVEADDIDGLCDHAARNGIDLTIVGPEDPLCAGIVDRFEHSGLRIFGPSAAAARIEGDKAWAKELMRETGVPTADARIFGPTEQERAQARQPGDGRDDRPAGIQHGHEMAKAYVVTRDEGVVVKAAGLAKGKGVFVHSDPSEALRTIEKLMVERVLGAAGERIVIEELLTGPEVSVLALVDGTNLYVLESASDYKRAGDDETGPNTGGMGAFSPSTALSEADLKLVVSDVLVPIVDALRWRGIPYRGVLYAGLMLTTAGPKVLEFNCRFGDPETQPILMRLQGDLLDAIEATIAGTLDHVDLVWDRRPAVCVVMASAGYPGEYQRGHVIHGLDAVSQLTDVQVFHAGTRRVEDAVVTAGGRVLGVTAIGDDLHRARQRAYEAVRGISFEGAYFRGDIAMRVSGR